MRAWITGLSLAGLAVAQAMAATAPRFEGRAELTAPAQSSDNGRYAIDAELRPVAAAVAPAGRFELSASLLAESTAGTACGPLADELFTNGFER
jgi:hypothetical protein